jgi:hypothetical protein
LSHASSPFCSGYFGDRVSLFAQPSLDHNHPIMFAPLHLAFFHWDGVSNIFCPCWPKPHPPNLSPT